MRGTKLLRTIRLDPSDAFVFGHAAEPGEWAVTGSFLFADADPEALSRKERAAFRSGFVGVTSLGFSTLAVVSEASEDEMEAAVADLARHIHGSLGAPSDAVAREAAREELAVSASLCGPAVNTVIAMHRTLEGGELREQFRTLQPRPPVAGGDRLHAGARAFQFVEVEEEPEEHVDLTALIEKPR